MASNAHAAWLHVCPDALAQTGKPAARVTLSDGKQMSLVVNAESTLPGCRSISLPVNVEQIDAIHPLASDAVIGHTILLDGAPQDRHFAIGSVTLLEPQSAPAAPSHLPPMPLHVNLLPSMQVRSFGIEERVQAHFVAGRLQVDCKAGSKPAGVILTGAGAMPLAELALRASFSGTGSFDWQVADAARAAAESGLNLGSLSAKKETTTTNMVLPARFDRASWKHFTIACPTQKASLYLDALELIAASPKPMPRSTWVWKAQDWQEDADSLLDWARNKHVAELFISVPLEEMKVRDAAALTAFIRRASAAGIAVWAVDGDPHMVLPNEHAATVQRAQAYAAYNNGTDTAARLRGTQFDIEPYLLPGYNVSVVNWEGRYLELARQLRKATGDMQLEFVVPFWWAGRNELMKGLPSVADSLAVMDYRTDLQEIYRFAAPFLDWATTYGKQVRIALEAGPIEPETQRRYVRADKGAGELWLLPVEGLKVLVLLKEARAHPDAQTFRFANQRVYDGSATTFHADKQKLDRLLPALEKDFAAWKGFGGIALHEFR